VIKRRKKLEKLQAAGANEWRQAARSHSSTIDRITSSIFLSSKGLVRWKSIPASKTLLVCSGIAWAVNAMIGIWTPLYCSSSIRINLVASNPFITGIYIFTHPPPPKKKKKKGQCNEFWIIANDNCICVIEVDEFIPHNPWIWYHKGERLNPLPSFDHLMICWLHRRPLFHLCRLQHLLQVFSELNWLISAAT